MEKFNPPSPSPSDYEATALLPTPHLLQSAQKRRTMAILTLLNLFVFTISMLSLMCTIMAQKDPSGHSAAKLMDQFGIYSPAMHIVSHTSRKFALPSPLNSSKYVGITDEVENAWMDIAYLPDQMVPLQDFPKLRKPASAMQVTDPRTGETGYRVGLEVFHQLHCLNLLRMSTYPEYYREVEWSDISEPREKVRAHLDHCIEILRLNLMCFADVNVFTFHEQEGREGYWPDYETEHVCRNFEGVKEWANMHAMPEADV
ncbi:hypothetical protein P153DRAFT_343832 [Dothidotthia symphoricarpi CBS 119687]|uniref:Tat pathway signal sequence n=1 Tax=Dothidotthia symphoricarpi CBS 119687 TaxID=1392245 RepID=A0A6A6A9T8_9PLEO|nr:uncharacterized protein P153DRAFT_343832 [Dothidotthia symphoricarpi CBS 119687]KAF2127618.1 hypothetical protein P153DRAFT_343832 [Dothidotthia symphoricarpi CBS 119687]